jgi:hypothetical protein
MANVYLGNHAALYKGKVVDGQQVTTVHFPDGVDTHQERMRTLTHSEQGIWNDVSGHEAPRWVASDDSDLATAIGSHYGCQVIGMDEIAWPADPTGEGHGQEPDTTETMNVEGDQLR